MIKYDIDDFIIDEANDQQKRTGRTFVIGKIGLTVKFDRKKWLKTGGDNEFPTLIFNLAKHNPNDTFIIISANDFDKLPPADKPTNIINGLRTLSVRKNIYDGYLTDTYKDTHIDGGIIMSGPAFDRCLDYWPRLCCQKLYCAPIVHFLNNRPDIKWVNVENDPRCSIKRTRDLQSNPCKILSQYTDDVKLVRFNRLASDIDRKNEIHYVDAHQDYAGVEKICLIGAKVNNNFSDKRNDFNIVLNEGYKVKSKSRYSELKKWILDNFDDVSIYGTWYCEEALQDPRFKGALQFDDCQRMISKSKFSFIIPIAPGWVTAKYCELILQGVVPLFHPDYDTQKHLNVPEFLRIKNPEDLKEKIKLLTTDNDFYINLITKLQNTVITEDDISGKTINDKIMENF